MCLRWYSIRGGLLPLFLLWEEKQRVCKLQWCSLLDYFLVQLLLVKENGLLVRGLDIDEK